MSAPDQAQETEVETATVELEVAGEPVRFDFPDAPGLRPFVEAVLRGDDYPIVFPGLFEARTIVDVGAHAGAASVYLKRHYPDAEVYAFEPSSLCYAYLRENLAGLSGVWTRRAALAGRAGEAQLYAGRYSSMQASLKPNQENRDESETVEVLAADAVFAVIDQNPLSIVKLDTEGCELEILRAIRPQLPRACVIYLEYHSEADRLAIDALLCPAFGLYAARAEEPDRGTNTYVRADLLEELGARRAERYVFPKS